MRWQFLSQWMLVLVVLLIGMVGAWAIIANRPQLDSQATLPKVPLVVTIQVKPQTVRLNVYSQGIVKPRTQINLVSEVAGKITHLHPELVAGGFFAKGDILATIDPRDYEYGIVEAKAKIAQAKRQLEVEKAHALQAHDEWEALGEGGATPLTLRQPHLAEARAGLFEAEANLSKARLQRSRCDLKAPFAGRVNKKHAGIGQYVQVGENIARLYATDIAEIRLPLSTEQLASIELFLGENKNKMAKQPKVIISHPFDDLVQQWQGRIVRMESTVDELTGLIYVIAEIRNPYESKGRGIPLLDGLFVQAEIEGRELEDVFVLPQSAVNSTQKALLVGADDRLHIQQLLVLRDKADKVFVKAGLIAGDQVIISGIQVPIEGMRVKVEQAKSSDQQKGIQ